MTNRAAALGLALALLALAPCAAAQDARPPAPVHAELEVRGPASFAGAARGSAAWEGSVHDARLGHAGSPPPLEAAGLAVMETHRFVRTRTNESLPGDPAATLVPAGNSTQDLGALAGLVTFVERDEHASVRLVPHGASLPVTGSFAVGSPFEVFEAMRVHGDAQQGSTSRNTYPDGGFRLESAGPTPPPFTGRLVVTGYLLDVGGRPLDTRWAGNTGSVPAVGDSEAYETKLLVLDGRIAPGALAPGQWLTVASGLDAVLDGRLSIRSSEGSLAVGTEDGPGDVPAFDASGNFSVQARYADGFSRWTVDGTSHEVVANGEVAYSTDPAAATAVRVAAAAGLLALLLAALARWTDLLSLLPGTHRADPLRSGHRLRLLRVIATNPGINQLELVREAGGSRATVRHHLRVLLHAELLTERRLGSAATYTLNSESFGFPAPGAGDVSAGVAMAWLRHPVRRRLVEALQELGEADYDALQAHWARRGEEPLARWDVSHHGGLLEEQSILRRRRDGRRILWSVAFRKDDAVRQQRRAFLVRARLEATARALAAGPGSVREVRDRLRGEGIRSSLPQVERHLILLEATGYAAQPEPGRFEPVPGMAWAARARSATPPFGNPG